MSKSPLTSDTRTIRLLSFNLFRSRAFQRRFGTTLLRIMCVAGLMAMTYLMIAPRPGEISPIIRSLRQQFTGGYVLHFAAYCVMTAAGIWTCSIFQTRFKACVLLILTIHAIASEVAQIWIPTRSWDLWDIACNLTGILAGLLICEAAQLLQPSNAKQTVAASTEV